MMRSKPFTSMQKTYDECFLTCSTAIYFERQNNETEALRSWRSALNTIYYHNAYNVPAGYMPKSETERALQESLREMELQCKERVDMLDALESSRKEAQKEAKKAAKESAKEEKALRKAAERNGSSYSISSASGQVSGYTGDGNIASSGYPDLSPRPPALPARPSGRPSRPSYMSHSTESLVKPRAKSVPQTKESPSPLPAAPTLPVPAKKQSRSPSPTQGKTTMRTTLRAGDGKGKSASRPGARKPPAASKAAGLAWDHTVRTSSSQSTMGNPSLDVPGSSRVTGRLESIAARKSLDDARPLSDGEEYRRPSMLTAPNPGDQIPTSNWREPRTPASATVLDDHIRQLKLSEGVHSPGIEPVQSADRNSFPLPSSPPPPPPHGSKPRTSSKPNPPPPRNMKPPELSYRREYPPATLKPGATSIAVNPPRSHDMPEPASPGRENIHRKPLANSSTPRTDRTRSSQLYTSTSSGSEDALNPLKPAISPRRKAVRQKSKQKAVTQKDTPPSSDELGDPSSPTGEREWEVRSKAIMKDLPRGVDEAAAKQILNDIVVQGDEVHWSDIAGLELAKKALKEAVVYPFLRPDLFMGLREPARGMLLFGPPGTGKTMLARAVATESKSTFFAISASSLTSKWHGESEKLVRALFALAKKLAPSIIFVDEIDSLLSARSSGEHEASRRSKTEFLIQWSDLQKAAAGRDTSKDEGDPSRVLVLAATNVPWDIDEAARRRFIRRQYIPLPEVDTRRTQLLTLLSHQKHNLTKKDLEVLVQVTEGFSGSDITSLAKDAAMGPLRNLGEALLYTPMDQIRPIHFEDFEASLISIRPSVSKEGLKAFEDWSRDFGERGG